MSDERCCGFIAFGQVKTDFCRFSKSQEPNPQRKINPYPSVRGHGKDNLTFSTVEPSQLTFQPGKEPVRPGRKGVVSSSPLRVNMFYFNTEHACSSRSSLSQSSSHRPVTCLACGFIFRPTVMSRLTLCTKHQECACL